MHEFERINGFLGLSVDKVTLGETLDIVETFIASGEPHQIVVLNAAKIVIARSDAELKRIILSADLIGADGVPLIWVSKLLGNRLPGRVNGTDLMEEMLKLANKKGYRVYFFGAKQEVVEKVVEVCKMKHPHVRIAGFRNGYFSHDEEPEIVNNIRNASADMLLIALPTPLKEKWVARNLRQLSVPVCHGVGGSFDVFAGYVSRAPVWMQEHGLEWLYRLYQEPRKMLKRYLVTNTLFVAIVIEELVKKCLYRKF